MNRFNRRNFLRQFALSGTALGCSPTLFSCIGAQTGKAEASHGLEDFILSESDKRGIQSLRGFIPSKIFDVHVHLYDTAYLVESDEDDAVFREFGAVTGMDEYVRYQNPLYPGLEQLRLNLVSMPDASMSDRSNGNRQKCNDFLVSHLEKNPGHVGETFVLPDDTVADIKSLLIHPNIRGFKCYHSCAHRQPAWQAEIEEYLPESAWQVADEYGYCITLHMVKDHALSDVGNFERIRRMAKKYPSAKLILAHAARGFAAWTVLESVAGLADIPNIYFDVSAVCEPTSIFAVLKAAGTKRVLWGSDFPVSMMRGKCISIADSFLWLYREQLQKMDSKTSFSVDLIGVENLLALKQACQMLDIGKSGIEDIFYHNAMRMFDLTD
jgi:glutamate-1-semialdehyde 2,1-aminomutase